MARATRQRTTSRRGRGRRSGADPPGRDPIEALRLRIDVIDRRLVGLLNERAAHAIALGSLKRERGLPVYQPAREEEVLDNVQGCNGGPLEDAALRRLFERVIDESRRIERIATVGPGEGSSPAPAGSDPDPAAD